MISPCTLRAGPMGRGGLVFLICIFATQAANADDARLQDLSAKLNAIRGTHDAENQYDTGPELTPIKHALREWVEGQLPLFGQHGDAQRFEKALHQKLSTAGLVCDDPSSEKCSDGSDEFDPRGFVDDVHISHLDSRYLLVETDVGVLCGYDESAYIFAWRDSRWRLLWETEQNDYRKGHYAPQNFFSVTASAVGASTQPLVLTLGYSPWCQSAWQRLFVRLWRMSSVSSSTPPLFDMTDTVYLGDEPTRVRLSDSDAMIVFDGASIDGDILVRRHVWHLAVRDHSVQRLEPVALDPRSFVDEWLTRPWTESGAWIDAKSQAQSLRHWHGRFHESGAVFGSFNDVLWRCRSDRTLWQVGFTRQGGPINSDLTAYFLVRWMAPYRFTLVDIRKEKSRDCDVADPMRDNVETLFPFR
jgi:hypothetical protein